MNFEYNASGPLKIRGSSTYKVNLFISKKQSNIYRIIKNPVYRKIVKTNRFTILANGSMATNGFVDKMNSYKTQRDKSILIPFLFEKCA